MDDLYTDSAKRVMEIAQEQANYFRHQAIGTEHLLLALTIEEKVTKLTTKECELLSLLCAHANEVLERNYALKTIWVDDNYFNARSMDVYITKLRKLLKDDPGIEIINIHGKGYKLITPSGDEQNRKENIQEL